ncbi:quinone-dependent dihydroorotate dehydrogenase [Ginsengibacter hankyongi]|uniref:Dihydroorotate dehydrogenase (quinone) n=1 Tax=Ginsengibacter hankyongi TaxID=2607284 RepID=A0A5J5IPY9_9BACT|nr:quinone-dependent dihydroorotate dehydrogenase [Ginsengibacter hankyongi]KAA9041602.1 quinone-dependent dihydroorotate dehydrogenase [Ginsengibacter hankyongi]
MYKLVRNILFWFDAEKVHYFSMNLLKFACKFSFIKIFLRKKFSINSTALERNYFGLVFPNPVGLAAGFDKNAKYLNELMTLGFGFVEIGTVTPVPQDGNPKPRLFRLPKDKAIVNRMGFNNDGVVVVAERLYKFINSAAYLNEKKKIIIGGNIGKNKNTPNEDAWKDYETCFSLLHNVVDYFVVNVSSPNTPGLRDLQQKDSLKKILLHLQSLNKTKKTQKPLLLKISPDLSTDELDDIIDLAMEIKLDGLVAANTTIKRINLNSSKKIIDKAGAGGLSGKPLMAESTEITHLILKKTKGKIPVISSGGIFTPADADEKFIAGAALVQVWTGFIYEGPCIAKKICRSLI